MKAKAATPLPTTDDPAALARQATAESAAAMHEGRFADARQLAALADSYARIAERMPRDDDFPIDAAGEEEMRQDLLRRMYAKACSIAEEEGWPMPPDPFSPDFQPGISYE